MKAKPNTVTIVIPVYSDWNSLNDCIESLKKYVLKQHKILLVNDCGPEADALEEKIIESIKGFSNFSYVRNDENLGFVKTCNRAVDELDKTQNDILLLNSDTKVTENFLEELLNVFEANDKIAAVSPRSNNASIFTVPLSMASKKGIDAHEAHNIFSKISGKLPPYNTVPVAHGFCMLIRRSVIKKFGLFDEEFGKGYGEEVDFCQRILKHGYLSAVCNRAFVFHLEAKSFSLETKNKLIEEHNHILWERYPNYRQSVRDYMDAEIPLERKIEQQSGVKKYSKENKMKNLAKRSPRIYKLARRLRYGQEK